MNAPKVKLNNGVLMPIERFGVFQIPVRLNALKLSDMLLKPATAC